MEFAAHMPLNQLEVEAPAPNASFMSDYCRFAQIVLSMPLMDGSDVDFAVGVEQVDGSLSDGHMSDLFCIQIMHIALSYEDERPIARTFKMIPSIEEI